jgi:small redox-active disulfide protein 2
MKIEVLGPGCQRCNTLEENVRTAVRELGIEARVTKVSEITEIAARGVFTTPGLALDGQVVATGRLLSVNQIKQMLSEKSG